MKRLKDIQLKVCGMRDAQNISELYELRPNYMGLIFWEPSKRYVDPNTFVAVDPTIQLIGVFVNETVEVIFEKVIDYHLSGVQLHGSESVEFCTQLKGLFLEKNLDVKIIKAFSVGDSFDFSPLKAYENSCDYFLFDTKGALPGGTGKTFAWELLSNYNLDTSYFLSGGISESHLEDLERFFEDKASEKCVAIDVNSKFEISPALKDIEQLKRFKTKLNQS
jgi:phosphoribosylanthranilate isomerase